MWQGLAIAHQKKSGEWQEWSPAVSPVLRTCLRQIQFLSPAASVPARAHIYSGSNAHRFLGEICAGLHSPLLGETEVFGQFRAFRDQHNWSPTWTELLDSIEADARKVRRIFMSGLGAQSYG